MGDCTESPEDAWSCGSPQYPLSGSRAVRGLETRAPLPGQHRAHTTRTGLQEPSKPSEDSTGTESAPGPSTPGTLCHRTGTGELPAAAGEAKHFRAGHALGTAASQAASPRPRDWSPNACTAQPGQQHPGSSGTLRLCLRRQRTQQEGS